MRWALILAALLVALPAAAQTKKIGGPVGQVLDKIEQNTPGPPGGFLPGERLIQNAPCDYNLFASLNAKNLGDQLRFCNATKLADDIKAALDSATAANDKPGIACLQPALAIVQAAVGTPLPVAADAPAGTEPAIKPPGLVLIFQKFREFVLSGGVPACKSWVNVTIVAGQPIGQ